VERYLHLPMPHRVHTNIALSGVITFKCMCSTLCILMAENYKAKAWVGDRSLAGIVGTNSVGGVDVCVS
jgi:hypothetical protein